jgi:signal transduction histidine kinase/CheY-like chemotaxis protein/HPt (histidine-containing phosphotransfer) domain-containing protein
MACAGADPVPELKGEGITLLSGGWNYRYEGSWQSTTLPARFDPGDRQYPELQLELVFSVPAELAGRRLYLLLGKRWGPVQAFINGVEVLQQGRFAPDYHYHEARRVNAPVPEGLLRYGAENRLRIRFGHERDRTFVNPPAFGFEGDYRYYETLVNFINVDLYRYLAFLSLFVAAFYLMQFLVRPKERSTLIFALVNLGLTVYLARIGYSFPSLPLIRSFGVSKAVFFPTITLMTTFVADYLDARGPKRLMPLFWLTSTVSFIALSFFGETSLDIDNIFTVSLVPVAAEIVLMAVMATQACRRKNPDALPILIGVSLGGAVGLHDLVYMLLRLYPDWWIQSVAFFVFDMGVFASLAVHSMRLHDELEQYSGKIERKVLDRTRELQRANQDLYDAVEAARHASQAKSRFLANISHEMRTPLNCIIGFSEMLGRSATEQQHKNLDVILEESERLLTLINQLLDIEKIEAGKISLDAAPFNLENFLQGISNSFAFHCAGKGLRWRVIKDESVPVMIEADSFRLRQVLDNLISNAVKFTSEGSVVLEVKTEMQHESRNIDLRFSVSDTGIGIPREQCEIIFDSFEQGDSSRTRLYGGTGLGTTIAKQLVTLMRGEIAVESEVGSGSIFWFSLPCRIPVDNDFTAGMAPAVPQPASIAGNPLVLVVEDYAPNRVITRSHLESAGCSVKEAATGREAVSMAASGEYDLILMDIQMPEMDGVEATRVIRRSLTQRRIPILGLTANAFPDDIRLYREAGMDGVLTKPLRRDVFLSNVASWLVGAGDEGAAAKICDLEALKAELDGDRGQMLNILKTFDEVLQEQVPRIESAYAKADWKTLHRELHSIRGGALNLFARELGGAAAPAERAAKERRGEELSRLLPELIRVVRRFHALVEELDL